MHNTQWALDMLEKGKHVKKADDTGYAYKKVGDSVNRYDIAIPGHGCNRTIITAFADDWEEYIPEPEYVDYKEAFDAAVAGKKIQFDDMDVMIFKDTILVLIGSRHNAKINKSMLTEKKWIILPREVSNA